MRMFTRRTAVPLLFTLGAMAAGFFSLLSTAEGAYLRSAQLIMLALVLDGLDGKIARVLKATSKFGAEMDTFVDFCCFGVAPAFLAHRIALQNLGALGSALPVLLVMSGAMRLARFRVIDAHRGGRGFTGLPITVAGAWVALWAYLETSGALAAYGGSLTRGPISAFVWSVLALFTFLQISRVHYAKTTRDAFVFAGGVLCVAALFLGIRIGPAAALALAAYGVYYGLLSPIFPALRGSPILDLDAEPEHEPDPAADEDPAEHPFRLP